VAKWSRPGRERPLRTRERDPRRAGTQLAAAAVAALLDRPVSLEKRRRQGQAGPGQAGTMSAAMERLERPADAVLRALWWTKGSRARPAGSMRERIS
jgi:hypothetical protein